MWKGPFSLHQKGGKVPGEGAHVDKDGECRLSGNGHTTSRLGHFLPDAYNAELRGAKTRSNSYDMHGDAYMDADVSTRGFDSSLAFESEADLRQTIGGFLKQASTPTEVTGIHNARGGGGRGAYKHIAGDFHGWHRNEEEFERAVTTPPSGAEEGPGGPDHSTSRSHEDAADVPGEALDLGGHFDSFLGYGSVANEDTGRVDPFDSRSNPDGGGSSSDSLGNLVDGRGGETLGEKYRNFGGGRGKHCETDRDLPIAAAPRKNRDQGFAAFAKGFGHGEPRGSGQDIGRLGTGGGRGSYNNADGDVPAGILHNRSAKTGAAGPCQSSIPDQLSVQARRSAKSTGGGRGIYDNLHGDVPVSIRHNTYAAAAVSGQSRLRILSWNAAGMTVDSVETLLTLLEDCGETWDAVLIQEGPKRETEELNELDGGHLWYVASCHDRQRSVAILLHSRWASSGKPCFETIDGRLAQVSVVMHGLQLCLLTAHLPHAEKSDVEYEAALSSLERAVVVAKRCSYVLVGIDANAVIGQQSPHDSKRVVGKCGLDSRNERGVCFVSWLHFNHLAACNTMYEKPLAKKWTHQSWSTGNRRQIDFILIDGRIRGLLIDSEAGDDIDVKSDHRCLNAVLQPALNEKRRRHERKTNTDARDLEIDRFHAELDQVMLDPPHGAVALADRIVLAARASCKEPATPANRAECDQLRQLLDARRSAQSPEERKVKTRMIWMHLKAKRQQKQSEKLDRLLAMGKGGKGLARMMQGPVKRRRITAIKDTANTMHSNEDEVLEVFAKFYEDLYSALSRGDTQSQRGQSSCAPVTPAEVIAAMKKLRSGKSCGDDGLYAEMLKTDHVGLITLIANIFTDILQGAVEMPGTWCISRLVVLYKKGDATLPKNYRPIAIIPVLCKLFSGILLGRIGPLLESLQEPEQGGFRPDHSCSDVIMFMRMIAEKADEWGEEIWSASLDLEKAFDKIFHASVLAALFEAGVDSSTVHFLKNLYAQQSAYVCLHSSSKSRLFQILRGVRQGDPMSPALFNNVTRRIFGDLKAKWASQGLGTMICGSGTGQSTHAMFADDTTLFASSKKDLVTMIKDVRQALALHGLNLNVDKCLVQTNGAGTIPKHIEIDGQTIPIVSASEGFKVLGTQFTLRGRCSAELKCRMAAAWGKFHALWPLLGKRDGNLDRRLRLFDTCVTQTALWCSESWLLTQSEKRMLQTTQHAMLRRIAGPGRMPDETWVDWIKRSTRKSIAAAKSVGIRMWLDAHLKSKWCWAGHVIRMAPGRLACRAVEWRDSRWQAIEYQLPEYLRIRRPGRKRWFRWEDDLVRYAAHKGWDSWQSAAQQRDSKAQASLWHSNCEEFCKQARK